MRFSGARALQGRKALLLFAVSAAAVVTAFGQHAPDPLFRSISSGTIEEKRTALAEIRNLRNADASRLAVPALSDAEPIVRATAAASVVFLPAPEAADLLLRALADPQPFVRKEAAYALARVGSAAVGTLDRPTIAQDLGNALKKEKDYEVSAAIVIAMGSAGGPYSVGDLVQVLQRPRVEDDEFLRRSAARSIGTAAEIARAGHAVPQPDDDSGETADGIGDLSTRFSSFDAAGKLLLRILRDEGQDDAVRREAAAALGNIGYLAAIPALGSASNNKDPYLAANATNALKEISQIGP